MYSVLVTDLFFALHYRLVSARTALYLPWRMARWWSHLRHSRLIPTVPSILTLKTAASLRRNSFMLYQKNRREYLNLYHKYSRLTTQQLRVSARWTKDQALSIHGGSIELDIEQTIWIDCRILHFKDLLSCI